MKSLEVYSSLIKYSLTDENLFLNKFDWREIKTIRSKSGLLRVLSPTFRFYNLQFLFIKDKESKAMFFGEVVHQLFYCYEEYRFGFFKFALYYLLFRRHFDRRANIEEEKAINWFLTNEKE